MTHCTYPNCNCPFDAPADPNWCARGLPKAEATTVTQADRVQFCHSCLTISDHGRCCPDAPGSVDMMRAGFAFQLKRKAKGWYEYLDALPQSVMRASIVAYKEGKNGIERHPGNTAHENAAWEWGRKDGGWDGKH